MTYDELNKYILNYIDHNKTSSAIMLSGGWGIGKSYYIQHTLKPFLIDNNKDCVIVSLYGLNEIYEISKSLYLEIRFKNIISSANKIKKKFKHADETVFAAKTIFNGVFNYFGVDLNLSDSNMNELYRSIDFKDKLLILEDVERSNIEIIELLGYVNNLVEQDGVKVLLVANENEIAKQVEIETNKNESKNSYFNLKESKEYKYTDEALEYLRVKEKTVSDTIEFKSDNQKTIYSIIDLFDNKYMLEFKSKVFCDKIQNIFNVTSEIGLFYNTPINFRTFIFATQKFLDILSLFDYKKYPKKFIDDIYYSIIGFSIRLKNNRDIIWDDNINYSLKLGYNSCPLYKFCFDYIMNQNISGINIDDCYKDFLELYNHQSNLETFRNYAYLTEKEVTDSIKDIEDKIDKNEISLGAYGEILYYLVTFEKNIEYDICSIFKLMIENVKGKADKLGNKPNFYFGRQFDDKDMDSRYDELSDALIQSANQVNDLFAGFSYNIETLVEESRKLDELYYKKYKDKPFLIKIDVQRFAELFIKCSATQMIEIRTLFQTIYKNNKTLANPEEYSTMKYFIETLEICDKSKCDKIQQLHIKCFISNLKEYCKEFKTKE